LNATYISWDTHASLAGPGATKVMPQVTKLRKRVWVLEISGGWGLGSPWSSSSDVVITFNYVETMW